MQLELRVAGFHRAEQILVPLQGHVGIVPALQQQLIPAERDRLVDLAEDLVEAEHVAVVGADGPDSLLFVALDNLIAQKRVPPMIAISIGNGTGDAYVLGPAGFSTSPTFGIAFGSRIADTALSTPTQATAREPTAGTSFRLAAVTTPNVPSAPISSWPRS